MDQNLTYQKARRIRGTKLTDLLSDQLMYEPTVGQAIKKTISLKLQSRVKGFKERFDPLNIVKYLTMGSTLGPALYGKLAGRDPRDIQYFTGRTTPIRVGAGKSTASRITPLPGGEGNVSGINEQLLKIYNFLQTSTEQEIKRKEKEQNFAEERALESEKRHKEFVEALKKLKTGKTTASKVTKKEEDESGNFFDGILSKIREMVQGMIDSALKVYEWIKEFEILKKFLPNLLSLLRSPFMRLLLGPLALIGVPLLLASYLKDLVDKVTDYSKLTPEEARTVLENGSERDIEKFGGRDKLKEIAGLNTEITKAEAINALTNPELNLTDEERKKYENIAGYTPQTPTQLGNVTPRDVYGGGGKNAQKEWDAKFGDRWNPDGTPKVLTQAKPLIQGVEPSTAGAGRGESQLTDYMARQDQEKTGGRASFGVKPKGIPTVDDRLNKLISQNAEANLPNKPDTNTQSVVNNLIQSRTNQKQELASLAEIAVHNDEPTFLRMIMNSTRIV